MNKLERFHAAVTGAAVDRVPVSLWLHFVTDYVDGHRKSTLEFEHPSGTVQVTVGETDGAVPTPYVEFVRTARILMHGKATVPVVDAQ